MRQSLVILAIISLLPGIVSAQGIGITNTLGQAPFTIAVEPQYPAPHSSATLTFLSSILNLSNATVAVTIGGKKVYQGAVETVTVPTGATGVPVSIQATVTSLGTKYTQNVTIIPQEVSIVVEPLSSAPPLYAGKPQTPLEGDVRIVAVAHLKNAQGKSIDPATVAYTWTVDDTTISESSGVGKQSLLVTSPQQYRNREVSVAVASPDGTLVGGDSVTLFPQEPRMRIYENDPLLGIRFDHALSDSFTIQSAESTLFAAPFSLPLSRGTLTYQWYLNGATAQAGPTITLRPSGSGEGTASLSITASVGTISTVNTALSLSFKTATTRTNFFGL